MEDILRSQIVFKRGEITPASLPEEDQVAYIEALEIQRRAELVMATGWTFDQLDAQNRTDLAALMTYNRLKAAMQQERDSLSTKRRK